MIEQLQPGLISPSEEECQAGNHYEDVTTTYFQFGRADVSDSYNSLKCTLNKIYDNEVLSLSSEQRCISFNAYHLFAGLSMLY